MAFLCLLLGHQRSVKRALFNYEAQRWESACKLCGCRMIRLEHRKWQLKDELGAQSELTQLNSSSRENADA